MTTIFLIRHSEPLNVHNAYTADSLQLQNEKKILSIEGEEIAKKKLKSDIFNHIDCVYSSNYTRAISTAKYIAEKNNVKINIVDALGERKFGISAWDELPTDFERKQFLDENYKIGNGESQNEVRKRMSTTILEILNENKNKTIAIFSHATAISYFLKNWCDIEIIDDKLRYSFNETIILFGDFNYCETFKLYFDDDNDLINIENIKLV